MIKHFPWKNLFHKVQVFVSRFYHRVQFTKEEKKKTCFSSSCSSQFRTFPQSQWTKLKRNVIDELFSEFTFILILNILKTLEYSTNRSQRLQMLLSGAIFHLLQRCSAQFYSDMSTETAVASSESIPERALYLFFAHWHSAILWKELFLGSVIPCSGSQCN